MIADFIPQWYNTWSYFGVACVFAGLSAALVWARIRNHLRHRKARPAVTSLAVLFGALAYRFGLSFYTRVLIDQGQRDLSLAINNSVWGELANTALIIGALAVFWTLAVLYPEMKPRDAGERTRHDD